MKCLTLEMSLKPFKKTEDEYIRGVCKRAFSQWAPLAKDFSELCFMLWTADGSELLDYKGNADEAFEWSYYLGTASKKINLRNKEIDPDGLGLHTTPYLYTDEPPVMTYRILAKIVKTLKEVGDEIFPDKKILIGTTFDPGPEFAKSDFKYERHPEICLGGDMGKGSMVCAYSTLHADSVPYAGFPNGIPEGLPFGTFLGRQAQIFMTDIGFDYIWLSNGFGFGRETWSTLGAIFDCENFHTENFADVRTDVLDFWTLFRKECSYPVWTRGTNMTMGVDFSTDGVPLREIYKGGFDIMPPPNSPWAALDKDYGLELAGHMSRIADLPDERYLFRYYIHDPWWVNSPWYDRYNGQPHDIYLPMAISRINEKGEICPPTHLNLLSIDNSYGDLPDSCANEPIPHILRAIKESPDEAAPFVWVYPFDEYCDRTDADGIRDVFFGDWFIRDAINQGLALSSVVSTSNFNSHDKKIYQNSVLFTPVPEANGKFEDYILDYAASGKKVVFYGSTSRASEKFLEFFGITHGEPASGELELIKNGEALGVIDHDPLVCGGGICEISKNAYASLGGRAYAIRKGNTIWLRGSVSASYKQRQRRLIPHDPEKYFVAETLMLDAAAQLGFEMSFEKEKSTPSPVFIVHKHDGAFVFSSFHPSTTVKTKLRFPLGAPILDGYEARLENGYATYNFPKAEHRECRVFVEQAEGEVGCFECPPVSAQYRRRICISGLKNATVRVIGENYCKDNMDALLNSKRDFFFVGDEFDGNFVKDGNITYYEARNVTGTFTFSMPQKKKFLMK